MGLQGEATTENAVPGTRMNLEKHRLKVYPDGEILAPSFERRPG